MWYHVYVNKVCYLITQDASRVRRFSFKQRQSGNRVEIRERYATPDHVSRVERWAI